MKKFLFLSISLLLGVYVCPGSIWGAQVSGELDPEDSNTHEHTIHSENIPLFFANISRSLDDENIFWNDASIARFVSKDIPLNDREYRPANLVSLTGIYINEAGRVSYLREEAHIALLLLAKDFEKTFDAELTVVSGYRSADYQKRLWDLGRCTPTLCAPPGYSEHQLGLAVDLFEASTEESYKSGRLKRYVSWVQENGHLYGYTQSYQNGPEKDGYDVEPWHWRYIGIPLATKLHELDMNYTEYIELESILSFWGR